MHLARWRISTDIRGRVRRGNQGPAGNPNTGSLDITVAETETLLGSWASAFATEKIRRLHSSLPSVRAPRKKRGAAICTTSPSQNPSDGDEHRNGLRDGAPEGAPRSTSPDARLRLNASMSLFSGSGFAYEAKIFDLLFSIAFVGNLATSKCWTGR